MNRYIFYKKKNSNKLLLIISIILITIFIIFKYKKFNDIIRIYQYYILKNKYYLNNIKNNINFKLYKNKYLNRILLENIKIKLNILKSKIKLNKNIYYKYENKYLKSLLNINIKDNSKFLITKIISSNINNSLLLINNGKYNNIYIGQPVINHNGIIGQVIFIRNNFSLIYTILNSDNYISSTILKKGNNLILNGYNNKYLCINNNFSLFNENEININDLLISSGLDKKYPEGYPIGKIYKIIKLNNRKIFLLKPNVNFNKLNYIALIFNKK